MKYAILYDYLQVNGGAERVSLQMLKEFPDARLIVSSVNHHSFSEADLAGNDILSLSSFSSLAPVRILKSIYDFGYSQSYINQYDSVIYSGFYSPLAIAQREAGNNFYYCHTPPRYFYDLKDYYHSKLNPINRVFLHWYCSWFQHQYEQAVEQMDVVIANSTNVQNRLKKYLNIDAQVIYPPVDIERFQWQSQGNYYVSLARLEPYKQVDKIIEAFKKMPEKQLIVASGGSDYQRLLELAGTAENISFTGWYSDAELEGMLSNAIASIYLARDEDFGLSPVESQAAGKPVIGMAQGGLLETVRHGETGYL
ncbi:MAG: glycosyltransferase, partial [Thiotrichaceae bacterium]|nr:glycosyltransferase [Thiotrichaceae bacterium]